MKIVINKCYGGFSLSHEATMLYANKKGIKLYPQPSEVAIKYNGEPDGNWEKYADWMIKYYTKPPEAREYEHDGYFGVGSTERTDPLLIEVVEELGDKANGDCAELSVIEIPDDIEYTIEEYDGIEWVAEAHRTWN